MNKRIILVGPTCSGKTFLRKRLEEKGFTFDVSYTTREPREGEVNGVHYNFISREKFENLIKEDGFYEHASYNGNYYGTGNFEWNTVPCFIMETEGISNIKPADRKNCFIIYLNPPQIVREQRMLAERRWTDEQVMSRIRTDETKFEGFKDYDLIITNADF